MAVLKLLTALVVLAFATRAAAHGGVLHEWPSTPTGSNYVRTKIASCSNWVPAKGKVAYALVNSTAAATTTAPVFRGDATVWQYLYKNCSLMAGEAPSAGVEFNVTVTEDGRPVGGLTLDGVAMTGSCASNGGSPYYFNTSLVPIDDEDNILWFHNFTTNVTGRIHGNGANDGSVRTAGESSLKSIRIVNTNTQESLACCDLTVAGQPNTDWAATLQGKGKQCMDEGHGSAAAKATEGSDPHAGHNMSDPDHDHSMMNMTTGTNSSARASSAAAPAVAAAGKLVAVMTVVISVILAVV